ncbi:exported hypothetical protein [Xanthomonas citri pv. fuscans]|nr:exported hypothetical protein [Xanthomonas citri pv. fuscans]SOO06908.1 exported hypothetical protein [Xanthomonas citri pv. fuscans]SOO12204.1 exported hypothetical protein [Xanthomonas citri pv. fuscans]SOO45272.1 exported hypothetical protein [Xanthomonas citri pv. fuscans]
MRNVLGLAALLVSAAGCSTAPLVGDLHTTGPEPAPAQIAGQWQFNALGNDAICEPVVILTTESANTCLSGEWFKAVVVSPGLRGVDTLNNVPKNARGLVGSSDLP